MNESRERSRGGSLFRLNVPPKQAFEHPQWRRARQDALKALRTGQSVVLVGLPGTGKTLLLQNLAQTLREEGLSVRFGERGGTFNEGERREILLVDEAGFMQAADLASVCAGGTPFFLAAPSDFAERLAKLDCAFDLVTLEPLRPGEVAHYVAASLAAAGQPEDLLEPDAVQALANRSHGLLRVINALGAGAVFLRDMEGAAHVTQSHVEEADLLRHGTVEQPAPGGVLADEVGTFTDPEPELPVEKARSSGVLKSTEADRAILLNDPCSPEPVAQARLEPGSVSSPSVPIDAEVIDARATTASSHLVPHVDATARPASSPTAAKSQFVGQHRDKILGATMAVLVLALVGGLTLLETASPDARVRPDSAGTTPTPATPRYFDAALPLPSAPSPPEAMSEAPPVPGDGVARFPEFPLPPQGHATTSQPASRSPANPVQARTARTIWQADVEGVFTFRGTVFNETMRQGGRLMLTVRQGADRTVSIRFEASNGLIGSGELVGVLAQDGRVTASGILMMGRNPHNCELTGVITNNTLSGAAAFRSNASTSRTRSTFSLIRA